MSKEFRSTPVVDRGTGSSPRISVVITCWKRREFLREAVESVLAQVGEVPELEVIVTKNFHDRELDAWLEERSAFVRDVTEEFDAGGKMIARGVELARAPLVAFLEDDDRYVEGSLRHALVHFDQDERIGMLRLAIRRVDRNGNPTASWGAAPPVLSQPLRIPAGLPIGRSLRVIYRHHCDRIVSGMIIPRALLLPSLDFLRQVEAQMDYALFLAVVSAHGTVVADDYLGILYRVHPSYSRRLLDDDPRAALEQDRAYAAKCIRTWEAAERFVAEPGTPALARQYARVSHVLLLLSTALVHPEFRIAFRLWVTYPLYLRFLRPWSVVAWELIHWAAYAVARLAPAWIAEQEIRRRRQSLRRAASEALSAPFKP